MAAIGRRGFRGLRAIDGAARLFWDFVRETGGSRRYITSRSNHDFLVALTHGHALVRGVLREDERRPRVHGRDIHAPPSSARHRGPDGDRRRRRHQSPRRRCPSRRKFPQALLGVANSAVSAHPTCSSKSARCTASGGSSTIVAPSVCRLPPSRFVVVEQQVRVDPARRALGRALVLLIPGVPLPPWRDECLRAPSSFATASLVISTVSALRNAVEVAATLRLGVVRALPEDDAYWLDAGRPRVQPGVKLASCHDVLPPPPPATPPPPLLPRADSPGSAAAGRRRRGRAAAADIWRAWWRRRTKNGRRRLPRRRDRRPPLPRAHAGAASSTMRATAPRADARPRRLHGRGGRERAEVRRVVGLPPHSACPTILLALLPRALRPRATPQSAGSRGSYIVPAALPADLAIGTVAVLPLYTGP